jgi:hypothetical protein
MIDFTITPSNRDSLCEKIASLDITRLWQCTIVERKSKRSSEQNRRLWGLIYKDLGKHLGLDVDEVHQICGFKFLRYQKEVNGNTEDFIKSTTKLNVSEMAEYQENIERWAANLGCYIEQ